MPLLNEQADASQSAPIHYAASLGDVKMMRILLQANAIVAHLLDEKGLAAIHIAASKGYMKVIGEILRHCPDATELTDGDGNNFLHVAAKNGERTVVKQVLSNPLFIQSINETNHEGNTPLHLAAMNYNIKIVCLLLLDSRVDKNIINKEGLTPIDIASSIDASKFGFMRRMIISQLNSAGTKFGPRRMDILMSEDQVCPKEELDRHEAMSNNLRIVAVLIVSVTFAAAFAFSGVKNNDGRLGSNQGQGIDKLVTNVYFMAFLFFDIIAMASSLFVSFSLIYNSSPDYSITSERDIRISAISNAMNVVSLALVSMVAAFAMGINTVLESQSFVLTNLVVGMTLGFFLFVWGSIGLVWPRWLKREMNLPN